MNRPRRLAALSAVFVACSLAGAGAVQAQIPSAPPPEHRLIKPDLWVIITTDTPGFQRPPGLFPSHLAHQVELEKKGILFAAGPVEDTAGKREYGMIIIRAANLEEARRIADSDPMHQSGARHYVLHKWSLNEGGATFTLNFSDSTVSFR